MNKCVARSVRYVNNCLLSDATNFVKACTKRQDRTEINWTELKSLSTRCIIDWSSVFHYRLSYVPMSVSHWTIHIITKQQYCRMPVVVCCGNVSTELVSALLASYPVDMAGHSTVSRVCRWLILSNHYRTVSSNRALSMTHTFADVAL